MATPRQSKRRKPAKQCKTAKRHKVAKRRKVTKHKVAKRRKVVPHGGRKYLAADLDRMGLAKPLKDQTRYNSFKALQKKWYDKLAAEGFEDIEHYVPGKPDANLSPYLKRNDATKMKHAAPFAAQHFRFARAFLMHYDWRTSISCELVEGVPKPKPLLYTVRLGDKLIWELYCEGESIRPICRQYNAKYKPGRHYKQNSSAPGGRGIFYICRRLQHLRAACMHWNKTHPDGLLSGNDDMIVHEVLLYEPDIMGGADQ